jgi:hypothetical protein
MSVGERDIKMKARINKTVFKGVFVMEKYQMEIPANAMI